MALTSVSEALTQAATYAVWFGNSASAALRYEALVYLRDNRGQAQAVGGASLSWASMDLEIERLVNYLSTTSSAGLAARSTFTRSAFRYI